MKILKLLNNKNLSIIIIFLLLSISSIAEEKPVDIWNLDKKETQNISEENLSVEKNEETSEHHQSIDNVGQHEDLIIASADNNPIGNEEGHLQCVPNIPNTEVCSTINVNL